MRDSLRGTPYAELGITGDHNRTGSFFGIIQIDLKCRAVLSVNDDISPADILSPDFGRCYSNEWYVVRGISGSLQRFTSDLIILNIFSKFVLLFAGVQLDFFLNTCLGFSVGIICNIRDPEYL